MCGIGGFISRQPVSLSVLTSMMKCIDRRGGFGAGRAYVPLTDGIDGQQVNRLVDHRIVTTHEQDTRLERMLCDPTVASWSSDVVCEKGIVPFEYLS